MFEGLLIFNPLQFYQLCRLIFNFNILVKYLLKLLLLDEMYVLSARNKKVTIELLGKHQIEDKFSRFEELTTASLAYLGVSFPGPRDKISSTLPSKLLFLEYGPFWPML